MIRTLLTGLATGAGISYLFDPRAGRTRRAMIGQKMERAQHTLRNAADDVQRDLGNRTRGLLYSVSAPLRRHAADDGTIAERVRSELGRYASHPGSVQVFVESGHVTLSGPIFSDEVNRILRAVRRVYGVRDVTNNLEAHTEAGSIPGLQGERSSRKPKFELAQENWSPAARFMVGSIGFLLALRSLRHLIRMPMGLFGAGILYRALTNKPLLRGAHEEQFNLPDIPDELGRMEAEGGPTPL